MTRLNFLLREVLRIAERRACVDEPVVIEVEGYAPGVVAEHIHLAVEAGFLEGERDVNTGLWYVSRLTYAGHEELARMRQAPFLLGRA